MEQQVLVEGPVTTRIIADYLDRLGERHDTGGHSIFLGQVRDDMLDGKKVSAIEYTAYEEMVVLASEKIKTTIRDTYSDVKDIVLIHSTGLVQAGKISLFVLITAGHRDHATKACRHTVELIKENFPVWKKEIFEDESTRWKQV